MESESARCEIAETEREKRCISCGEYWPADEEFFVPAKASRDGLSARCHACVKERLWVYVRPGSSI
jgi:hypothetical protein